MAAMAAAAVAAMAAAATTSAVAVGRAATAEGFSKDVLSVQFS